MIRLPIRSKRQEKQAISEPFALPAPYRGLNTRDPLDQMKAGFASVLSNWWPSGVRVQTRAGAANHVTGFSDTVKTLCVREGVVGSPAIFAITDAGVYAATSAGAVGASLAARTEGWCRYAQFRNSAGTYLVIVNGTDDLLHYNGSAWTTVASFTVGAGSGGGTKNTNLLTAVEVHQRRLWFIEEDTADAWYQQTDLLTGDLNLFRIGAQFSKGGYLIALATWSLDSGVGPEDLLAFISSKGQVAVYAGLDPSDTAAWSLRGVFTLAEPLGRRCVAKVGGDCLIATTAGIFSLSATLRGGDQASSPPFTDLIGPTFNAAAADYGSIAGWQLQLFPRENMLLVNAPTALEASANQFAVNLLTGAWTTFTGWDALCWEQLGNFLYFGGTNKVVKAWTGADDFGSPITAKARLAYSTFGLPGLEKLWTQTQPNLTFNGTVALGVGMDVDFKGEVAYSNAGSASTSEELFGTAVWDTAQWAGYEVGSRDWVGLTAWPGVYGAFRLRTISSGGRVAWSSTRFLLESGSIF